ncbi:GTPase [Hominenteromicrobium sp.]|uniref:GTPase n=1 Tax=Hominenteromicrobium sp. TaxID=3073581 RepID=UPI00399AD184
MNFQSVEFEAAAGRIAECSSKVGLAESRFFPVLKSNVGKSSLINKLVNRKALARVSATPGKTATINFFRLPECRFSQTCR